MLMKSREEAGKPGTPPDTGPPVTGTGSAKLEREGQRPTQPVYQIQNRGMGAAASTAVDRECRCYLLFLPSHVPSSRPCEVIHT